MAVSSDLSIQWVIKLFHVTNQMVSNFRVIGIFLTVILNLLKKYLKAISTLLFVHVPLPIFVLNC